VQVAEEPARSDSAQTRGLSPKLQFALDLYTQGITASGKLSAAMTADGRFGNISPSAAYAFINQLEALRLIKADRRVRE